MAAEVATRGVVGEGYAVMRGVFLRADEWGFWEVGGCARRWIAVGGRGELRGRGWRMEMDKGVPVGEMDNGTLGPGREKRPRGDWPLRYGGGLYSREGEKEKGRGGEGERKRESEREREGGQF